MSLEKIKNNKKGRTIGPSKKKTERKKWPTVSLRLAWGIGRYRTPPRPPAPLLCGVGTWRLLGPGVLLPVLQDVSEADGDGDGGQRGQGTALTTGRQTEEEM